MKREIVVQHNFESVEPGKKSRRFSNRLRPEILLLIFLALWVQGCATRATYPMIARAGDTVIFMVGSPDNMNKGNTVLTYIPNNGGSPRELHNVSTGVTGYLRAISRIYPDKTSKSWLYGSFPYGIAIMGLEGGHGAWTTLMVVDLPLDISPGSGVIRVTSQAEYPVGAFVPTPLDMNIEILNAGIGGANPFSYWNGFSYGSANLSDLEPLPQVVIKPPIWGQGWSGATSNDTEIFGAMTMAVRLPMRKSDGSLVSDTEGNNILRLVPDEFPYLNYRSQVEHSWKLQGETLTVNIVSAKGSFDFRESRVSIVLPPGYEFIENSGLGVLSVKWYDKDGNIIAGPQMTTVLQ